MGGTRGIEAALSPRSRSRRAPPRTAPPAAPQRGRREGQRRSKGKGGIDRKVRLAALQLLLRPAPPPWRATAEMVEAAHCSLEPVGVTARNPSLKTWKGEDARGMPLSLVPGQPRRPHHVLLYSTRSGRHVDGVGSWRVFLPFRSVAAPAPAPAAPSVSADSLVDLSARAPRRGRGRRRGGGGYVARLQSGTRCAHAARPSARRGRATSYTCCCSAQILTHFDRR